MEWSGIDAVAEIIGFDVETLIAMLAEIRDQQRTTED